jgi:hypothetical protein
MNKFLFLFLFLTVNMSFAQSWDKFTFYLSTDKYIYEVDENSVSLSNDILNGWLKITDKKEGSACEARD